ncbi:hypothetical protein [Photorhabdus asymbiotica]|uniref:hypothetical protein n=1 Tax=Photorhabdus asymbiotica TaxID=291112 RepID=UPI003DA6EDD0
MQLIKDAISSFLGKDDVWKWSEHLHPASFLRGFISGCLSAVFVFNNPAGEFVKIM